MTNVLVYLIIPDVRPELDDERHDFCWEARELGNKRRRQGTEVSALVVLEAPGRLDLPEVGVRAARRMVARYGIGVMTRERWIQDRWRLMYRMRYNALDKGQNKAGGKPVFIDATRRDACGKRPTPRILDKDNYKPNRSFATTPSAPTNKGDTPHRFRGGFDGS